MVLQKKHVVPVLIVATTIMCVYGAFSFVHAQSSASSELALMVAPERPEVAEEPTEEPGMEVEDRMIPVEPSSTTTPTPTITEHKGILRIQVQDRLFNLAQNVRTRMQAVIGRFENINTRLDSRLTKMSAEGLQVEQARRYLEESNVSIRSAKAKLETIDVAVEAAITSDDPRAAWIPVREQFKSAREDLVNAHQFLRSSIFLAKQSTMIPATTTPGVTTVSASATTSVVLPEQSI